MDSITKKCGRCGKMKNIVMFGKGKNKDGLRSECRDCRTIEQRERRTRNPEKYKQLQRDNYQRNREQRNAYGTNYHRGIRENIFELLGHVCSRCGFSDKRALQVDHIFGGGSKETRSMSGHKFNKRVLEIGSEQYQILCANCNWIKRYENNEIRKR